MSRTRPVTPAELRQLLKLLQDPAALAVRISADTGLRVSDVLGIRCGDLARTMAITERKTGKRRKVTLRPSTLAAAKAYAKHGGEYLIDCDRSTIYRRIRAAAWLRARVYALHPQAVRPPVLRGTWPGSNATRVAARLFEHNAVVCA